MGQSYSSERLGLQQRVWQHECERARVATSFDIEKLTGEFYADPYATYRALREHEPVKLLPNGSCRKSDRDLLKRQLPVQ